MIHKFLIAHSLLLAVVFLLALDESSQNPVANPDPSPALIGYYDKDGRYHKPYRRGHKHGHGRFNGHGHRSYRHPPNSLNKNRRPAKLHSNSLNSIVRSSRPFSNSFSYGPNRYQTFYNYNPNRYRSAYNLYNYEPRNYQSTNMAYNYDPRSFWYQPTYSQIDLYNRYKWF